MPLNWCVVAVSILVTTAVRYAWTALAPSAPAVAPVEEEPTP
jgi:hypothetical protein